MHDCGWDGYDEDKVMQENVKKGYGATEGMYGIRVYVSATTDMIEVG